MNKLTSQFLALDDYMFRMIEEAETLRDAFVVAKSPIMGIFTSGSHYQYANKPPANNMITLSDIEGTSITAVFNDEELLEFHYYIDYKEVFVLTPLLAKGLHENVPSHVKKTYKKVVDMWDTQVSVHTEKELQDTITDLSLNGDDFLDVNLLTLSQMVERTKLSHKYPMNTP